MKYHLVKILYVEAAHRNPAGGEAKQRLHGHSYKVEILASGPPNAIGWVVDFSDLKRAFSDLYEQLDHHLLNEVPGLEADTTVPAVAAWIEARLKPRAPWVDGVRVSIVGDLAYVPRRLAACAAEGLPERVRFTFEAAQSLPQLPCDHHCRNVHGHSYQVEIGAADPDAVERDAAELHALLDHRYLNEIAGLEQSTVEGISRWIWTWLEERGHMPSVVVIQETPTARCLYFGE
jgi:6-pyruvoyltetrahydropterin/6-carboxytetrahydropterin synthase